MPTDGQTQEDHLLASLRRVWIIAIIAYGTSLLAFALARSHFQVGRWTALFLEVTLWPGAVANNLLPIPVLIGPAFWSGTFWSIVISVALILVRGWRRS